MSQTIITTGCKINYYLHVGGPLESGYHSLETLFIPLSAPADTLVIEHTPQPASTGQNGGLELVCNQTGIHPTNNTLVKAHTLYCQERPLRTHLKVQIYKTVPLGSGLGGGSANASGLLLFLEALASLEGFPPLGSEKLTRLAAQVGADVPFFLTPLPQTASGIGDILTPCRNPVAGHYVVLVCPPISISTPWAFKALGEHRSKITNLLSNSLTSGEHQANSSFSRGNTFQNDFEEVVFAAFPELEKIKLSLLAAGATEARLSGTGPSLFGVFQREDQALRYFDRIKYQAWMHRMERIL